LSSNDLLWDFSESPVTAVSPGQRERLWSKVLSDTPIRLFADSGVNENRDHRSRLLTPVSAFSFYSTSFRNLFAAKKPGTLKQIQKRPADSDGILFDAGTIT